MARPGNFNLLILMIALLATLWPGAVVLAGDMDTSTSVEGSLTEAASDVEPAPEPDDSGHPGLNLTEWFKLDAELVLRYEYKARDGVSAPDTHKGRYRYRIGAQADLTDYLILALGIENGTSSPRGATQSFASPFDSPDVRLGYAFFRYTPVKGLDLTGGKMLNPLYRPSDLIWDGDIRPLGGAVALVSGSGTIRPFLTGTAFILDALKDSPDEPVMWVIQPGVELYPAENINARIALAYYGYENIRNSIPDHTANTNNRAPGTERLMYDYDSAAVSAELSYRYSDFPVRRITLFSEYINNFDPDILDDAYIIGAWLGDESLAAGGRWRLQYSWRHLERDSMPDILPDSDAFDGKTNTEGHELIASVGITKNVMFRVDYYRMREITTNVDADRFQADIVFSFSAP